jgi:hypothetical protein
LSAQIYDRIIYEGVNYQFAATPLEDYFTVNPDLRPLFRTFDTSCMRGYVAQWEVRGSRLYLVGMEMKCKTESTYESIFPDAGGGLLADWVSGGLSCPYGKIMKYDHAGFERKHDHELILSFANGVLTGAEKRSNVGLA